MLIWVQLNLNSLQSGLGNSLCNRQVIALNPFLFVCVNRFLLRFHLRNGDNAPSSFERIVWRGKVSHSVVVDLRSNGFDAHS